MSKRARLLANVRELNMRVRAMTEYHHSLPPNAYAKRDDTWDQINHMNDTISHINAQLLTLDTPYQVSKPMDWNQYKKDLVEHKKQIAKQQWVPPPKTQYARKGKPALKTPQQLRKIIAMKKWLEGWNRRQRIEKAKVRQAAWRTNYYRQQSNPQPKKVYNVYPKKKDNRGGFYKEEFYCPDCGYPKDECDCGLFEEDKQALNRIFR